MITKIRTNGKMLISISGEVPDIELLLNFEKSRWAAPMKFGRNIVGKVVNATAGPGKYAAFPGSWPVLEHDAEKRGPVLRKDHAQTKGWQRFRNCGNRVGSGVAPLWKPRQKTQK
ncbi:hypothetical protein [Mesorhizobium shangrilense]|uniref:Alcohol dehydrogenase N-terminal domain-containing protein n=1 Tax=Mesorhizobium shangrilense TaxID=460060 RepID=A0ABV2D8Y7_9HYPH